MYNLWLRFLNLFLDNKDNKDNNVYKIELRYEKQKMLGDILRYGQQQNGVYKGIKWEMKRPKKTYWCVYINDNKKLNENEIKNISNNYIGRENNKLIFEFNKIGDYHDYYEMNKEMIYDLASKYKDYEYVINIIYKLIDNMIEKK
jgi:hypothetical protein